MILLYNSVFFNFFLLEWNSLEHLDCWWNLMHWHDGLFYSKWTQTSFSFFYFITHKKTPTYSGVYVQYYNCVPPANKSCVARI